MGCNESKNANDVPIKENAIVLEIRTQLPDMKQSSDFDYAV